MQKFGFVIAVHYKSIRRTVSLQKGTRCSSSVEFSSLPSIFYEGTLIIMSFVRSFEFKSTQRPSLLAWALFSGFRRLQNRTRRPLFRLGGRTTTRAARQFIFRFSPMPVELTSKVSPHNNNITSKQAVEEAMPFPSAGCHTCKIRRIKASSSTHSPFRLAVADPPL